MALAPESSIQATIVQISKSILQFAGSAGLKLLDSSGVGKITAADGTTLARLQVGTPSSGSDAATKTYVDGAVGAPFRLTGTTSTVTATATIPANAYVTKVVVIVTTALDGTSPTLSVGTTASAEAFVPAASITAGTANTQVFEGSTSVGGSAVTLRVTVGGSGITTGAFEVWVYYTATPQT